MSVSQNNNPAMSQVFDIAKIISTEVNARREQVDAAIALIDEGATIPFIARYRKEVTGGLDDTQLRLLGERLTYLRELESRRSTILQSIETQGKLTDDLRNKIAAITTKSELEDVYLPYKPKRRTRAQIARENGLAPLVDDIFNNRDKSPEVLAKSYINDKVADTKSALEGARDIIAENMSENADLLGILRQYMKDHSVLHAKVVDGKQNDGAKFADYFDHSERWATVPGHRALAMLRGRNEDILALDLELDIDDPAPIKPAQRLIAKAYEIGSNLPGDLFLMDVAGWAWRVKLSLSLGLDLMREMRERADQEAIDVFARNLKDLLLAAPAGSRTTIGLDPGIRTGVKVAVIDKTGKLLETATIYPFQPRNDITGSKAVLGALLMRHKAELIAIGNGTGSRETEKLVNDLLKDVPEPKPIKVIVSEAGASVYSASELAAREFPELDVSLRGAVSIARRLQDPLAELVKIEPKSIGVGQYQHDVDQFQLAHSLDGVVEDAVNGVGVDLNTASAPLLSRVSGLGKSLAEAVVAHRDQNGPFKSRKGLLDVARLGAKAFEQCAGFLRIRDGSEPLDASSVHPEAYDVARKIVASCGRDVRDLMGDSAALKNIDPREFVSGRFGLPTIRDILSELEKPGRDPRPEFKTASFTDGIEDIKDLKVGMELEGTVTNVAAFGAFVDIGVHQDGLVHISEIADRFVKDPHEVVKAGDIVKVKVLEVDAPRKRISLSMRKENPGSGAAQSRNNHSTSNQAAPRQANANNQGKAKANRAKPQESASGGAFGAALLDAMKRKK
ncbi:RNA-binding transcriptional accessory protein [Bartonella sp. HY329]|nr:RNA-binding transcriptional accessory protein [Bartonella sp. HY329]UXN10248.1 RNA-binding transcriptional accessory protein [Bartonella sp. HY328]